MLLVELEWRNQALEPPLIHACTLGVAVVAPRSRGAVTLRHCRMGSDPRAVVDPGLRVQGRDRLWVADASVMPSVPRGHPNDVVAMIAEGGAGWIESALCAGAR